MAVLSLLAQIAFGPALAQPASQDLPPAFDGVANLPIGACPASQHRRHTRITASPCNVCPACVTLWTAPVLPVPVIELPVPTAAASPLPAARAPPRVASAAVLASFYPTGPPRLA